MNTNYNEIIDDPMTSTSIEKYFDGNANIKTFAEISKFTHIDEVFGNNDHVVLFVAINSPTDGHYQCMFKNETGLYFFDSYGDKPCQVLSDMKKNGMPLYGQDDNLVKLISDSQYHNSSYYNTTGYQEKMKDVSTCGRYCVMVLTLSIMHPNDFNLIQYNTIMKGLKQKYNMSYDEIVAFFVHKDIKM